MIMREFGVYSPMGHIINGHTPVKTIRGEKPVRGGGKLYVIDGGFCAGMHKTTGIAGYTMIYNSHGIRLKEHRPFMGIEDALANNDDIESSSEVIEKEQQRVMVRDTDIGRGIALDIEDLRCTGAGRSRSGHCKSCLKQKRRGLPENHAQMNRVPRGNSCLRQVRG